MTTETTTSPIKITVVPYGAIAPKAGFNHRQVFNGIDDLANSIATNDLEPLSVGPKGKDGKYPIIKGERRFRAVGMLVEGNRLPTYLAPGIPVIVREHAPETFQAISSSIAENVQRQDVHWTERTRGYLRAVEAYRSQIKADAKQVEIADALGITPSAISNAVRIGDRKWFPECEASWNENQTCINENDARELAACQPAKKAETLAEALKIWGKTVRDSGGDEEEGEDNSSGNSNRVPVGTKFGQNPRVMHAYRLALRKVEGDDPYKQGVSDGIALCLNQNKKAKLPFAVDEEVEAKVREAGGKRGRKALTVEEKAERETAVASAKEAKVKAKEAKGKKAKAEVVETKSKAKPEKAPKSEKKGKASKAAAASALN